MIKRIRKCSHQDCPESATETLIDRFYVSGIKSVGFYDLCPIHADKSRGLVPSPGHEPHQYRPIKALLLAAMALIITANAYATVTCPSGGTPPPGSMVKGGLEVDGLCVLHNVTVRGGIIVEPGAGLGFQGGSANGGIVVDEGGELDLDAVLGFLTGDPPDAGFSNGKHSTVNGGITLNWPADFDILGATIKGGITVNGFHPAKASVTPTICGNVVSGNLTLNAVSGATFIGDLDFSGNDTKCAGNTIRGNVSVSNSAGTVGNGDIELENNYISGSIFLTASQLQVNGNTIKGSLACSNGAMLLSPETPDKVRNSVEWVHCF